MKIEKIMKTFAIAAVMAGSVFTFSQTTEAATVSIEKAAEKIYKTETKAYNTKKDVSVTVKVAAPSKTKKAISKVTGELEDALIKEELGDVDLTNVIRDTYVKASIGKFISYIGTNPNDNGRRSFHRIYYSPTQHAAYQTATYKNGVLTIKSDIKGSKKWYRDQYKENTYLAKCLDELREQTEGMDEKNKAWTIAQWADLHFVYDGHYRDGNQTKYSLLWEGQSRGVCEQQARTYWLLGCLMGINVGYVSTGENHALNCVKIDGEIYYVDLPDVDSFTGEWKAFVKGQANASKISSIDNFKEWTDDMTVGEWCLLTDEEYLQCVSGYENTSKWKIFWKIGSNR